MYLYLHEGVLFSYYQKEQARIKVPHRQKYRGRGCTMMAIRRFGADEEDAMLNGRGCTMMAIRPASLKRCARLTR